MIFDLDNKQGIALKDTNGRVLTYQELAAQINKMKKLNPERAVAFILADNNVESLTIFLAMVESGIVPLMLNADLDEDLLEMYIRAYEPLYIARSNSHRPVSGEDHTVFKMDNYVVIKCNHDLYPIHKELSFLLSTSGTTGSPKLVRHKYSNMTENAKNVAEAFHFTKTEHALANLPIYFTQGLNVALANLSVGATVILSNLSLMSKEFWNLLKEEKIASITGVPFSYEVMVRLGLLKMDLPDLRVINEGGGRLNNRIFQAIAEYAVKTGKQFIPTYGATETTSRMAYLPPELAIHKIGSIGRPLPNGRIELVAEDGSIIDRPNIQGELVYYGPNVTMGYAFNKADLAKGDERNGRYATGDIAYFDEDRCFFIVGRKGRFTKIFGYRIGLDELEKILKDQFNMEFACMGDDQNIYIYTEQPVDSKQITAFLSDKLGLLNSIFKVVRINQIPRNSYGKILYKNLGKEDCEQYGKH